MTEQLQQHLAGIDTSVGYTCESCKADVTATLSECHVISYDYDGVNHKAYYCAACYDRMLDERINEGAISSDLPMADPDDIPSPYMSDGGIPSPSITPPTSPQLHCRDTEACAPTDPHPDASSPTSGLR